MNIVPVNIKTQIGKLKTDLKEYHSPDNIFPDKKLQKRIRIFEGTLAALACIAVAGISIKRGNIHELTKMSYEKFLKRGGCFKNDFAYWKGKPYTGRILKCFDDNTAVRTTYLDGMPRSSYKFNTISSTILCKIKYQYHPNGAIHRAHTRDLKQSSRVIYEEGGKIIQQVDKKITKIVQPMEDARVRITDYEINPKGVATFFDIPDLKK